jgi:hypothetical protein
MDSFASVIDAFGGPAKFGEAIGIPDSHARAMKARNSIPASRWPRVVAAAGKCGLRAVTFEKLAKLAARAGDLK